ncbi:BnaC09g36290D [Brassica napus]|uniref:BnaC09g36290D protein n=1 Tax=Brassica napus TaxID=3708 RepID=A0A078GNZ5_BRANA|nr:BnaC09g36290D [Brassica napus]
MSSNKSVTLVKNVKPFKTGWCIQVKLLHSWKQHTSYGGRSLELILADETGTKIHCSCKNDHMFRVERDLPLGVWRLITKFSLSNATGQYRPTNHAYKMSIIGDSKIKDSDFHCDEMFFSFASFEDVEVIGKKVEFRLRDTKGETIACCLWGKYAEQIESHVQEANDPNMILIEDPEVLPEPIKELVGQSFCFGVSLENDNVTNGSDIFMVSQIWSGDILLKAESHSVVSRESSMISGGEVSKSDPNSQTTSEGCSTPFSKRKDGDLPDMSSSSKNCAPRLSRWRNRKRISLGRF